MKNSFFLVVIITLIGLAWGCQHQVGRVESLQSPGGEYDLWGKLRLSEPTLTRISQKYNLYPVETVLHGKEQGRFAYAVVDRHVDGSDATDQKYAMNKHNNVLVLHDLNDVTAQGYLTRIYKPHIDNKYEPNVYYPFANTDHPDLSPNGRYLLFRMTATNGAYLLFVLDTRDNTLHSLKPFINVAGEHLTSRVISWSPDNDYIAYCGLGLDEYGNAVTDPYWKGLTRVYLHNWHTGNRQMIAAEGITEPFTWRNGHNLVYGSLPQEGNKPFAQAPTLPRPNIYEFSSKIGKSRLLIRDGYHPYPSPDGQWIAFFGSRDLKHSHPMPKDRGAIEWVWRYYCHGASLCVAKADGSHRIALQPFPGLYPLIQWLPDNRHFATIERTRPAPQYAAVVTLWDIESQTRRKLATLHVSDVKKPDPSDFDSDLWFPFKTLGVSPDGRRIYIKTTSQGNIDQKQATGHRTIIETLQSIDVATGKVTTIATVKDAEGLDWTSSNSQ